MGYFNQRMTGLRRTLLPACDAFGARALQVNRQLCLLYRLPCQRQVSAHVPLPFNIVLCEKSELSELKARPAGLLSHLSLNSQAFTSRTTFRLLVPSSPLAPGGRASS